MIAETNVSLTNDAVTEGDSHVPVGKENNTGNKKSIKTRE